jgi:FkbM family methyltransferase
MEIFVDNIYKQLPVKGKTVIDIGSNIADSCIYFALRGAEKIIGIEPFPKNYELAIKNVKTNNLSDRIILRLAGCDSNYTEITVDPDYDSGIGSIAKDFKYGVKIPLLTLKQILLKSNLNLNNHIILKMDCEGCEYGVILYADENSLRKFSHIIIEYHYGYKNLKEKLEKCGFHVSVTRPRKQIWNNSILQVGYLFAEK